MSLLDQKLAALPIGSHVRLVHRSGQIIEGIVMENDGKDALSVQITSTATLRYDQIGILEECTQAGMPQPKPAADPVLQAAPVQPAAVPAPAAPKQKPVSGFENMQIPCDKEAVTQAFKAMESQEKKALTTGYNKYQNYLQSHETSKCQEAAQLAWNVIKENEWDYNPRVNFFLGLLQLVCEDYDMAAESLFYAGNLRYAYCAAYQGAQKKEEREYALLAAAFAALFLSEDNALGKEEAAEVLQKSSVQLADISGITYALEHAVEESSRAALNRIIRSIGVDHGKTTAELQDMQALLESLRYLFPGNAVRKKITKLQSNSLKSGLETEPESVDMPETPPANDEPDLTKTHTGYIISYDYFEGKGKIQGPNEEQYLFDVKDITDKSLQKNIKKIDKRTMTPIPVKFQLLKSGKNYLAVSIKRGTASFYLPSAQWNAAVEAAAETPAAASADLPLSASIFKAAAAEKETSAPASEEPLEKSEDGKQLSAAISHWTAKKAYSKVVEVCKTYMDKDCWEDAFTAIIMCYLRMNNENEELGYLNELRVFVEKYADREVKALKALEALQQYYMKTHQYAETIRILNRLMEQCDPGEHSKILHYLQGKGRCYREIKDYPSAISELLDWLDIVKRNKITERYTIRNTCIYIELAELYFETGDYENAEKYVGLSSDCERKQVILQNLADRKAALEEAERQTNAMDADNDADDGFEEGSEPEESLQTAYESYTDTAGFEALGIDDSTVISKALHFQPEQLHCLLTYLNSAAMLTKDSEIVRNTEDGTTVYVGQAIRAADAAFAYAFHSPLLDSEYLSTEIMAVFDEAQNVLPDISASLFAASAMHALFHTPSVPDYSIEDFSFVVENFGLDTYPAMLPLLGDLVSFREKTGYGMDSFAAYKTNSSVIESVIDEAKECCNAADMRNDVYENHGQVRCTRELLFVSEESELRTCLNIVAANETDKFQFVKDTVSELFIRANKPIQMEYLDVKKVDKCIDDFWERARVAIQNEGKHIARPHEKIKGSKRNSIMATLKRMLSCICDWLAVAEHFSSTNNAFAKEYDTLEPKVTEELTEIVRICNDMLAERGFDWGTESVRRAATELLEKMNGTYNPKTRKYFFMDFLRGEDVLLNDNYLPETQSTFCGMPDFHILYRIEQHASKPHPELPERLSEILSNVETKHNFRTARLIKAYGEDMDIAAIREHKDLAQYGECLKQAKQRFETMFQDFSDELELCESYGTLSNINGEKSAIMAVAYAWYRITRVTNDYGFYVRLLEVIRNRISVNAVQKGERLLHQLEELADSPDYDFGVFSKEMIEAKINDQNYSSAEFIMSCILRRDVSGISDYSDEPFGYFREFINEHATNYRAVRRGGKHITETIAEYSGKKDLDLALLHLTNNARKETRGGANLLKSWIPSGGPASLNQLEKLLSYLGFKPVSVQPDTSLDTEAYQVFCRKQIGKINYVHPIPAFGSKSETDGFRVLCLYGKYDCDSLMDKFREVNAVAKHTLVLLDFAMNMEERRRLARKIKEEKSFATTFIVIDRVILFYLAKHYAENTVIRRLMAVTLPFAYYQPFVESSTQDMPPELFTGREAELTQIESPEGANLVYGGRQLGKSALLKMARHNIDKNGNGDRAVLVEELKDRSAAEAVKIVSDKLILEGILDESTRCDTWTALAGHLQKRFMDENPETRIHYLLLMLDEADEIIKTSGDTEDSPITALKSLPSGRFKLVMAGLHNVSRYHREMMHENSNLIHLNWIVIKQFRREEATKLLTCTLSYLGFRFNQDIIDNILASTYNFPGLIQFYCQKLLEAMKNEDYAGYGESVTPFYEVTESHYKKVLSDTDFTEKVDQKLEATLFTDAKERSNYHIIALIIAYLCYVSPNEKGYTRDDLLRIAEEYHITRITSLKPNQFEEILNEMLDLNVVSVMDNYYRFATDGFRKFLGSQDKVEKSMADYFEEEVSE